MVNALNIWMNGELVGVWSAARGGAQTFCYDTAWLRSPNCRALSLSLPLANQDREIRGDVVANYFENLLPESVEVRKRLAQRFRTRSAQALDLLGAIGRDCVGAVQLLAPDAAPTGWNQINSEPLSEGQIEQLILSVTSNDAFGLQTSHLDDFRISIAGAQEKTALLKLNGAWHQPHGATPTTHIIKLPLGLVGNLRADMSESVENEWLCALIMRELGFEVANCEICTFGAQKVLAVERFDRRLIADAPQPWIARLPQEDLCQASGVSPLQKYESDGGPGIQSCLDLLSASSRAEHDRVQFALTQLAFWLLATTDGHAKNFSIFHLRGGAFHSTPLYDVLSAWPIMGTGANQLSPFKARLAMAVRGKSGHYKLREIQLRHWQALAQSCAAPDAWERMQALAQSVPAALTRVQAQLPADFPSNVWEPIAQGMQEQAQLFLLGVQTSESVPSPLEGEGARQGGRGGG